MPNYPRASEGFMILVTSCAAVAETRLKITKSKTNEPNRQGLIAPFIWILDAILNREVVNLILPRFIFRIASFCFFICLRIIGLAPRWFIALMRK